jgi:hypothetical protein
MFRLLLLSLLVLPFFGQAQQINQNELKARMVLTVNEMGDAFLKEDYDSFVEFMYSPVFDKIGGKDIIIAGMKNAIAEMSLKGIKIVGVNFGEPMDILNSNNTLQSLISQIINIKMPEGTLMSTAYLFAISEDEGKSWHFIDVSNKSTQQILDIIPIFSTEIKVPSWQKPLFIPN